MKIRLKTLSTVFLMIAVNTGCVALGLFLCVPEAKNIASILAWISAPLAIIGYILMLFRGTKNASDRKQIR